nr:TPA_asm: m33.6 sORF 1 [Murid betaherpesvirus 1]DBA07959.1 TPA_asm: m33.6 sORF 1 [Murid betaherpesvirus 1]
MYRRRRGHVLRRMMWLRRRR